VLNSGHRATVQALALAVHSLAVCPGQLERLRTQPQSIAGAVEELLRWEPPVQYTTRRVRAPVELHGRVLQAGELAVLMLGAANRDPAAFPGAERLDVSANAARHVSFGYGAHFCVGAALARMILQEALLALVARAPQLALAAPPRWASSRANTRGFESLHVRW
jgi:cytochrome P450